MTDIKLEQSVLSEINLTHQSLDEGVQHLMEWIRKQPHLPHVTDEAVLKAFIVGSKSVERAKERLDRYFTSRTKYSEVFANRDPAKMNYEACMRTCMLPNLSPTGCTVIFSQVSASKELMEKFDYVETCKLCFMLIDRSFRTTPITSGQYVVMDCKGMTLELVTKCITTFTYGSFDIYQNSVPIRMKGMICFNASSIAETFSNKILKAFLSGKLKERVYVHSEDHTVLNKYFPLSMLPSDYGGSAPPLLDIIASNRKDLESDREWFQNEGIQKSDELKRPKAENSAENIQGTFRKLQLD